MGPMDADARPATPRWRGRIHQVAFFVSVPAGVALVVLAEGWVARVAVLVYALSLTAVFGSSAAYHRGRWTPKALVNGWRPYPTACILKWASAGIAFPWGSVN